MKTARQLCIAILVVVSISALIGSYYLISDPSGFSLHMRLDDLQGSPFTNYSIPGWILLIAIGGLSIITIMASLRHFKNYPFWMMLEGLILLIWIFAQILIIREVNFLQLLFGLFGLTLFLLGNLIRRNLNKPDPHHIKIKTTYPNKKSHHHKHRKKH